MTERLKKYEDYRKDIEFINEYQSALNAATGSKRDPNANVENKNVTTETGEIPKEDFIGINRLRMIDKITELYGKDLATEYIRQIETHEIYRNDETNPLLPYCVSITMYPFLFDGLTSIGGISDAPTNLQSFNGAFINLVFAIAAQFAGAVSTPEYLTYLDYFIRKEYGDDYYLHSTDIVDLSSKHRTIDKVITDSFQQVIYSLNQPAAARNFQSVFWNIAYFDSCYFKGIFGDFVFPDGTEPTWNSVSWLQKRFMNWFNDERLKKILTFPVETMNLLNDGEKYADEDYYNFACEMYAKGHSFFTYTSDSVDSLASCCLDGSQKVLTKSSTGGVLLSTFKELYDSPYNKSKINLSIYHNGSWVKGKPIKLSGRKTYRITTSNNKQIIATDNHINPTFRGDIVTTELNEDDWLLFNNCELNKVPENDKSLSYEEGFLIGMYLGDGSIYNSKNCDAIQVNLSINKEKYEKSKNILSTAIQSIGENNYIWKLSNTYNNVYPLYISSKKVGNFIREYIFGNYSNEKELNLNCLLQSYAFRKGILEGYYLTDGGNSNRIYTTSQKLSEQMECLITSLGMESIINVEDRTDEEVIIRGNSYNRNYPLYCIRYYEDSNKRTMGNIYKKKNNSIYYKIIKIEEIEEIPEFVYCFEMDNKEEPYFTLPNGVITHNCRLKNGITDNTFSYTLGAGGVSTGSKGVITININRLVQNSINNNEDISENVREQVLKIHKYLNAFNETLKDSLKARMLPVFDAGYISLEKEYLTIGINGFVEGAEFLGIDISPNEDYFTYGETILKPIFEENKKAKTSEIMFNTEFIPAENLGIKNAKWDKKDGYSVTRDFYNSYFYKVEDESCNILDKFILHGKRLTKYLDGGSALHANLDEHLTIEQYKKLLLVAVKTGCSYFTFNIPNTICNECGHISKHNLSKCEVCGSDNVDWITRIIGYLKRISKFSQARQKEAKKRYYEKIKNC